MSSSSQPNGDDSPKRTSRLGIRRHVKQFFKGEPKKDSSAASPPTTANDAANKQRLNPLRVDIFPCNVASPILTTDPPKSGTRIENTIQLAHCYSLLARAQVSTPSPVSDHSDIQSLPLDMSREKWAKEIEPAERDHLRLLIDHLVKGFSDDTMKGPVAVAEIVLIGHVLERDTYRSLLACFISKFEQTTPLDLTLLQGLVQLVEDASAGYLVDNDLVRIATVMSKELMVTHTGTSNHPLYLTWALSRILDVMVAGKVKDLNRDRDHQPMLRLLDVLKSSSNIYLKYQAAYAYQALQFAHDDETPLQTLWRYTQVMATVASAVTSVFKMDPQGFLKGVESFDKMSGGLSDAIKSTVEGGKAAYEITKTMRQSASGVARATETKSDFPYKRSWYLALQGTELFIHQGRLADFNQVVSQAACRRDVNFQFGVCRQLGEAAVNPLWPASIRQKAVDFLGEIYRNNSDWITQSDVKTWILTVLGHISEQSDPFTKSHALTLLKGLRKDGNAPLIGNHPLATRLPLLDNFPLLAQIQDIPKVEYALYALRKQRMNEYKQAVYIPPMAKSSLQAMGESPSRLMDKVREFLAGDGQVMLILGDSGAGKSTFNRHLEYQLWQDYKSGEPIPQFINLPALERPENELLKEHLRILDFSDGQILELKQHRKFVLICDGYDESQLTSNLHTTNRLNQSGQWSAKLVITCRTQYLGPDYRDLFVPKAMNQYQRAANDLFQEAVIAPFSKDQIETYVERYVPLEPRTWVKADYMDKLIRIPNLMDLVKNPFLLTLCLEALPSVVHGQSDLSSLRVTRVQLYDNFVHHWLGVNKRRLQDQKLGGDVLRAFEILKEASFEQRGIEFQKGLAYAIFQEHEGKPVVDYIHKFDKSSWKAPFFGPDPESILLRGASLLSRSGTQYRFVHRSLLEYFYSCTICSSSDNTGEFGPHIFSDFTVQLMSIAIHPLSQQDLVAEPSIVQFLSERVQLQPNFKNYLLAIIELSKTDEQAARAAANAITILVRAGVRFHGTDLRGIRVPGADMSGGQFDSVQFQQADLSGANFTKCWIRQADFSAARMEGVLFGELPYLQEEEEVTACAYSPDGRLFAVGLIRGLINIYDTAGWTLAYAFQMKIARSISSLVFSPNRPQLISRGKGVTAQLWNYEAQAIEFDLGTHMGVAAAVTFSPCGRHIVSIEGDNTVMLRDAQTGEVDRTFTINVTWPTWVVFSPDGGHMAVGSTSEPVRMFDSQTGFLGSVLENRQGGMACVVYSPDGQWIVSGDWKGNLQLWETATGKAGPTWKAHPVCVNNVDFSANGQWIASCGDELVVRLWDARTGAAVSVFAGHIKEVSSLAFSPDGSQLASCSQDRTVRLWDMSSTGVGPKSHGSFGPVTKVAYSSHGLHVISDSFNGTMRYYDEVTGQLGVVHSIGDGRVDCIAYSPDGLRFAAPGHLGDVTIRNARTGAAEVVIGRGIHSIESIAFSPRWIATGSVKGTLRLWDASSGEPGRVFTGHTDGIKSLAFSPNGQKVVSAGVSDGYDSTWIWTVDTGECKPLVGEKKSHSRVTAYSMDGLVLSTIAYSLVQLWDANTGQELGPGLKHNSQISCVAISPCSQWIATGGARSVFLWISGLGNAQMESRQRHVLTIGGFFGNVNSIVWKPDAGHLEFATGCQAGSIRTWRLREVGGFWSVLLLWSDGPTSLTVEDAVFDGVQDLSPTNQKLLLQRGAKKDHSFPQTGTQVSLDEFERADIDKSDE